MQRVQNLPVGTSKNLRCPHHKGAKEAILPEEHPMQQEHGLSGVVEVSDRLTPQPKNSFSAALAPCPCFFGISRWPEAMNHSGLPSTPGYFPVFILHLAFILF